MGHSGRAEHAVSTGEAIAPLPLLSRRLDYRRVGRYRHIFVPGEKAGGEHSGNADPGPERQALLEPGIFRLVMGAMAGAAAIAPQRQRDRKSTRLNSSH